MQMAGSSVDCRRGAGQARAGSAPELMHEYVVHVRGPKGEVHRATVSQAGRFLYNAGSTIHVEINFKTDEVKIDKIAMPTMAQEMLKAGKPPDATWVVASSAAQQKSAAAGGASTGHSHPAGASGQAAEDHRRDLTAARR